MSPVFLLLPVFLPILGGLGFFVLKFQRDSARNAYSEAVTVLTTALVWIAVFAVPHGAPAEVYSFTAGFSVTFQVDGPGALFAGMISLMWPLVLLYAFEYMEHAERKNVFFAFYVMTYGVALGIAFSADMITMYVFYEMLTLVTIPLVAHYADHESMFAGRKYAAYTIGGAGPGLLRRSLTDDGLRRPRHLRLRGKSCFRLSGGPHAGRLCPRLLRVRRESGALPAVRLAAHRFGGADAGHGPAARGGCRQRRRFCRDAHDLVRLRSRILSGTRAQIVCLIAAVFSLLFGAVMASGSGISREGSPTRR